MAGITDFAFRSLARNFGAGFSYSEMISARGLVLSKNQEIYKKMLYTLKSERPCAVQIFGNDPKIMAKACQHLFIKKFDVIDINMGCPAPKIVKNCEGSALLKNLDNAVAVAKACVEATDKPITCKLRIGFEDNELVAVELAKRLEKVGVSAITIHGRTKNQMYSGTVNYEEIKKVKQAVKIPVIGNGDIRDNDSLKKMLETGVDAVMIGRASMGKPWIFAENFGTDITNQEKYNTIIQHYNLLKKIYDEHYLTTYFRKHLLLYVKDIPNSSRFRLQLAQIKNFDEAVKLLKIIYKIK